jgi:hypothetical protein
LSLVDTVDGALCVGAALLELAADTMPGGSIASLLIFIGAAASLTAPDGGVGNAFGGDVRCAPTAALPRGEFDGGVDAAGGRGSYDAASNRSIGGSGPP